MGRSEWRQVRDELDTCYGASKYYLTFCISVSFLVKWVNSTESSPIQTLGAGEQVGDSTTAPAYGGLASSLRGAESKMPGSGTCFLVLLPHTRVQTGLSACSRESQCPARGRVTVRRTPEVGQVEPWAWGLYQGLPAWHTSPFLLCRMGQLNSLYILREFFFPKDDIKIKAVLVRIQLS